MSQQFILHSPTPCKKMQMRYLIRRHKGKVPHEQHEKSQDTIAAIVESSTLLLVIPANEREPLKRTKKVVDANS